MSNVDTMSSVVVAVSVRPFGGSGARAMAYVLPCECSSALLDLHDFTVRPFSCSLWWACACCEWRVYGVVLF